MKIENAPEEEFPPLQKITEMRWRIFACRKCGTEKWKWMFWISEADAKANKDHRQQCAACNKISRHDEIFPPEQS